MTDGSDDTLPDHVHARVSELSDRGNVRMQAGLYDDAIAAWQQALDSLPQPEAFWDAALWLHASIGDALRSKGDIAQARGRFLMASRCADGATNPFVLFNLGACDLDLGEADQAVDPLLRAYMLDGDAIFEGEDEKYMGLLKDRKLAD